MNLARITDLLALNDNLRIAHWQASTTTNEHKTLGELYDTLSELTDDLAEATLGKMGPGSVNQFPSGETIVLNVSAGYPAVIGEAVKVLAAVKAELNPTVDDDLLNIVADMSNAVNKARYLLKV